MRYLRKQVLNRRAPFDQRLSVDITNGVVMNTPNSLLMPKGATSQQPVTPLTGMMRYNSTTDEVEIYQGASATWRALRYKEATKIVQQSLGNIDGYSYFYGPLNASYNPANVSSNNDNFDGQNILVLIENVLQIFNTNYVVTYNPNTNLNTTADSNAGATTLTFADTSTIPTQSVVSGSPYIVTGTIATVISSTQVSLNHAVTGGNILTGHLMFFTAPTGYYLNFTSDLAYSSMIGKPITVLHGFDK